MAYSLHIHRGEAPGAGPAIPPQTWSAAKAAEGIEQVPFIEAKSPVTGQLIRVDGPFDVWMGHSSGGSVVLRAKGGVVTVDGPDSEVIMLLSRLARRMDAVVSGEDGERYG